MTFVEFLLVEKIIEKFAHLNESIFDDLAKLKKENTKYKINALSRLLFYIKMHQGSAGNTDLKAFYSEISLDDKLKQIDNTIKNHPDEFKKIYYLVSTQIDNKERKIYNQIYNFFSNKNRVPSNLQIN